MTASESLAVPTRAGESGPARRLIVSISLVVAIGVLGFIPLPGVNAAELARLTKMGWGAMGNLSIGATGYGPIMSGFIIVEVAALVVPRWRHLRLPGGRTQLERAAFVTSVVCAAFQGFGIAMYLEGLDDFYGPPGWMQRITIMGTLAAFTSLELLAIAVNARFGLGSGLSFFLVATWLFELCGSASKVEPTLRAEVVVHVVPAIVLVVAAALGLLKPTMGSGEKSAPSASIPPFTSGLPPLNMSASLATFLGEPASLGALLSGGSAILAVAPKNLLPFVLVIILTVALSALFHPLDKLARFAVRATTGAEPGSESAEADARDEARSALRSASGRTLLFLIALTAVPLLATADLGGTPGAKVVVSLVDAVLWVTLTAIAIDFLREWRARAKHENWTLAAVEHRVYAARILIWALEREGVAVLARGLEARSCLHFFGPYIPVEILVHASEKERAKTTIDRILAPDSPDPPGSS